MIHQRIVMKEIKKEGSSLMLETVTGKLVDISNPQPEQIDIEDIAWALSRIPRFGAHTTTFIPYNVAQHSIFVAEEVKNILSGGIGDDPIPEEILRSAENIFNNSELEEITEEEVIIKALLHDAAEAYIGDIPSPVKKNPELSAFAKIELRLMEVIYKKFDLTPPNDFEKVVIKYADKVAQKIEANAFMVSRGQHWNEMPHVSLPKLQSFKPPLPALDSYKQFIKKFNEYI